MAQIDLNDLKLDYPSNNKSNPPAAPPKVEKVVNSEVAVRQKSSFRKFIDAFVAEDVDDIKTYLITDVLVPAIKDTISDLIHNGSDLVIYGQTKGNRRKRNSALSGGLNVPFVSYGGFYNNRTVQQQSQTRSTNIPSGIRDLDNLKFNDRFDAELVLEKMRERIAAYHFASINDLYDLCGVTAEFTSVKWGWSDLSTANIVRARGGGWLLNLPKAEYLP